MNKKIALALVTLSILLSACTTALPGGHSVTVRMPHNDCNVAACTSETTTEILSVR
jgi:starvation-inducible outer membrane lipoprotein